jgi:hypothetical protein
MARWAQRNQVVERVLANLRPRFNMIDLDWHAFARWDRAAVASFNLNSALQIRWDGWPAFGHHPIMTHASRIKDPSRQSRVSFADLSWLIAAAPAGHPRRLSA